MQSREIHLKQRPTGVPTGDDFALVTVDLPAPNAGQVLVRNLFMSVDPYMRGRMVDRKSYTPPFQIGEPLTGGCAGQVIESHHEKFAVGDYVLSSQGWREAYLSDGGDLRPIDPLIAPVQAFLGTVGMPGQTAYFGLLDIGQPQPGETVFVSAAAGAVGSVVCQIAKIKGCRVVGSAGSQAKIDWLVEELGVDAAFNYKQSDNLTATLREHAPDGVDVYFENVGGEHLQAALANLNQHGRVPVCGMISGYNDERPEAGPTNLSSIIGKRLTLQGFIVSDYADRTAEFYADMREWVERGDVQSRETIVEGIENAPEAFIGLFSGENIGKMLVKIGEEQGA